MDNDGLMAMMVTIKMMMMMMMMMVLMMMMMMMMVMAMAMTVMTVMATKMMHDGLQCRQDIDKAAAHTFRNVASQSK